MNPTPTVLQKIMNEILKRLTEMPEEEGSGTGRFWNTITFGDVSGINSDNYPAVGVYEGTEDVIENLHPLVSKNVTVFVSFRYSYRTAEDTDVYDHYRYIIGKFQALFLGDYERQTLGGLCNNIQETGNNPEIEGRTDPAPGGVFMMQVQYDHINGQPHKGREAMANGDY